MKACYVLLICLVSGLFAEGQTPKNLNQLSDMADTASSTPDLLIVPIVESTTQKPFDESKYAVHFSICNAADSSKIVTSDMILPQGHAVRFKPEATQYLVEIIIDETTDMPDSRIIARRPPYWVKIDMSEYNLDEHQVTVAPISVPKL